MIRPEFWNGLEYLAKKEGRSVAGQLQYLLVQNRVPQLSNRQLEEKLKEIEVEVAA